LPPTAFDLVFASTCGPALRPCATCFGCFAGFTCFGSFGGDFAFGREFGAAALRSGLRAALLLAAGRRATARGDGFARRELDERCFAFAIVR